MSNTSLAFALELPALDDALQVTHAVLHQERWDSQQ